ncbi:MAG TPA: DciA family protein [Frankiaceae bacterium]|nr:DciA family protein [Frankiaceae bacterium]
MPADDDRIGRGGADQGSPDPAGGRRGRGLAGGERRPRGSDLAREALARARADARARGGVRARAVRGADRPGHQGQAPRPNAPPRPDLPGIAAPGRDWQDPVPFGAAIDGLLVARGWQEPARAAAVLARWDHLVGSEVAARCRPVGLRDGELVLAAESTAWATQLRLLSRQLLSRLRRELGPDLVTRIVVRGPTAPTWSHGPIRTPGRGPRDTYG